MTNLEWLQSLEPHDLKEWFESEHVDKQACKSVGVLGRLDDLAENYTVVDEYGEVVS